MGGGGGGGGLNICKKMLVTNHNPKDGLTDDLIQLTCMTSPP